MEDMKKELYEEYLNLEDIGIIWNSILDEFNLKWNNINIIYSCYEQWGAKNPTYIANKVEILMLDQLTNLFVMSICYNIEWALTFKLIKNGISTNKFSTNELDTKYEPLDPLNITNL
ncbi:hypothetical protein RhiirA5_430141 [Rhizophagus irregularis]|uniref:Uncharacterized protein n=1 Tax=Rhizophagus irregularis TaxID=588596 RepID=A0A2N0NX99_9GLOM|nr:hypothetical protein RhiirA5_430141 [Rhizophagus irregularis]